jgi:hypothetical protein
MLLRFHYVATEARQLPGSESRTVGKAEELHFEAAQMRFLGP